jgi:hypothetical protein
LSRWFACEPGFTPVEPRDVARDAVVDSVGHADNFETLFRDSVVDGGLWFDDPACAKFAAPGEVARDQLSAFAHCLAELPLKESPRHDALGDVTVLDYAPGIELEARVVQEVGGPHLSWIGYASHGADDPMVPMITSDALESIRLTGDRNGPVDAQIAGTLGLDPTPTSHAQFTWIKVCLDETGAITKTHGGETTSDMALAAFEQAAKGWTFKPFAINGRAVPVCSMARMTYPAGQGPSVETLPMPAPPPKPGHREPLVFAAGAKRLEGKRISGTKVIRPDVETTAAIAKSHVDRVTGSFRVCLTESGHVESVLPTTSTGYANYDRKLMGTMQQWVYSPYTIDGVAVPVCTSVTFSYH